MSMQGHLLPVVTRSIQVSTSYHSLGLQTSFTAVETVQPWSTHSKASTKVTQMCHIISLGIQKAARDTVCACTSDTSYQLAILLIVTQGTWCTLGRERLHRAHLPRPVARLSMVSMA